MMDWTDRHCRFFHRLLAPHAVLYTEMVTAQAVINGARDRLLGFDAAEHPVVLQLGGSEATDLAEAAKIGADMGYDAINLNCGCPSERVQKGAFGACLMAEPALVAECVAAMKQAVRIPVTVKCRIGIDDCAARDMLFAFTDTVRKAGCETFVVHARKAWLKGLSPRENREVPPLDYDLPYALKRETGLEVILNGGITDADAAATHLERFDGVMLGRAAYQNPSILQTLEARLHGTTPMPLSTVIALMGEYADRQKERTDTPVHSITRHMLGLVNGRRGARRWRQILGAGSVGATRARDVLIPALEAVEGAD